jgi:hypothetical protein
VKGEVIVDKDNRLFCLLPFVGISLSGFLMVGYLTLFSFRENDPVIVVFPPWISNAQAVETALSADSALVRSDLGKSVVMVAPRKGGYVERVRAMGAWFVISSFGIRGCSQVQEAI